MPYWLTISRCMDDRAATGSADANNDVESRAPSELLNLNARVSAFVTCPAPSDRPVLRWCKLCVRDNKGTADVLSIQDGDLAAKAGYPGFKGGSTPPRL